VADESQLTGVKRKHEKSLWFPSNIKVNFSQVRSLKEWQCNGRGWCCPAFAVPSLQDDSFPKPEHSGWWSCGMMAWAMIMVPANHRQTIVKFLKSFPKPLIIYKVNMANINKNKQIKTIACSIN
jgi:hypothetical protein